VYTKGDTVAAEARARLMENGGLVTSENGAGLPQLLARLSPMLPERPFEFDPDDVGTQPVRFFVEEYLREAAFDLLEEEVPYSFNAQVEEFREDDRPVYIRVTLYVERETQKAILIGAGGRTIKAIGSHARRRLEPLIGAKVYLDCWVKVLPNWRKNAAALTRFGFPENG
jgi:GTP-binding protein Era